MTSNRASSAGATGRRERRNSGLIRLDAVLENAGYFTRAKHQLGPMVPYRAPLPRAPKQKPEASRPEPANAKVTKSRHTISSRLMDQSTQRKPKPKVGFLSLPGEIRNKIMDYALVPGEIYLSTKCQPIDIHSKTKTRLFVPGCQLLATCKQAYLEGHESFYGLNNFHLAHGPLFVSMNYFASLNARHQDLIKHVTIDLSVVDLTWPVLERIEAAFRENERKPIAEAQHSLVARYVCNGLLDLWAEKIAGVRNAKAFDTVTLVSMLSYSDKVDCQFTWRMVVLRGKNLNTFLEPINPNRGSQKWGTDDSPLDGEYYQDWDPRLKSMFEDILGHVKRVAIKALNPNADGANGDGGNGGWEKLKKRLGNLEIFTWVFNGIQIGLLE